MARSGGCCAAPVAAARSLLASLSQASSPNHPWGPGRPGRSRRIGCAPRCHTSSERVSSMSSLAVRIAGDMGHCRTCGGLAPSSNSRRIGRRGSGGGALGGYSRASLGSETPGTASQPSSSSVECVPIRSRRAMDSSSGRGYGVSSAQSPCCARERRSCRRLKPSGLLPKRQRPLQPEKWDREGRRAEDEPPRLKIYLRAD